MSSSKLSREAKLSREDREDREDRLSRESRESRKDRLDREDRESREDRLDREDRESREDREDRLDRENKLEVEHDKLNNKEKLTLKKILTGILHMGEVLNSSKISRDLKAVILNDMYEMFGIGDLTR